jgi:hypothetical protein
MKCDVNPNYWEVKTSKATDRTTDALKNNALVDFFFTTIDYRIYSLYFTRYDFVQVHIFPTGESYQ